MSGVSRLVAKVAGVVSIIATVAFVVTGNPAFLAISAIAGAVGTPAGARAITTLRKPAGASP